MLIDFNYIALRYLPLASCGDNHRDSNPTKKEVVVYYAGIDAHSKSSTICVVDRRGRTLGGGTMVTSAEGLRAGLNRWLVQGVVAAVESKLGSRLRFAICSRAKGEESVGSKPQPI
jgi:hypothetical protein